MHGTQRGPHQAAGTRERRSLPTQSRPDSRATALRQAQRRRVAACCAGASVHDSLEGDSPCAATATKTIGCARGGRVCACVHACECCSLGCCTIGASTTAHRAAPRLGVTHWRAGPQDLGIGRRRCRTDIAPRLTALSTSPPCHPSTILRRRKHHRALHCNCGPPCHPCVGFSAQPHPFASFVGRAATALNPRRSRMRTGYPWEPRRAMRAHLTLHTYTGMACRQRNLPL